MRFWQILVEIFVLAKTIAKIFVLPKVFAKICVRQKQMRAQYEKVF
jgi:hypothetical protein